MPTVQGYSLSVSCEPPNIRDGNRPRVLQEQQAFLVTEPSLQPLVCKILQGLKKKVSVLFMLKTKHGSPESKSITYTIEGLAHLAY